uniref:Uncharacterized protein n=1 Tax=Arundo donax TaxID=35708 RepID=A0A0A9AU59_ARUDO
MFVILSCYLLVTNITFFCDNSVTNIILHFLLSPLGLSVCSPLFSFNMKLFSLVFKLRY